MLIVDAHLDLAYNALRGRDVLRPAAEQAADEEGVPTVGLPDLRAGGVGLVCSTIFCSPAIGEAPGYRDADEAHAAALKHLQWYQGLVSEGLMRFVTTPAEVPGDEDGGSGMEDREAGRGAPPPSSVLNPLSSILLLEGADPLRTPADVAAWFAAGLRI